MRVAFGNTGVGGTTGKVGGMGVGGLDAVAGTDGDVLCGEIASIVAATTVATSLGEAVGTDGAADPTHATVSKMTAKVEIHNCFERVIIVSLNKNEV